MDQLIVYGSQYGTTQRYAERFSQLTRLPCIRSEAVKDYCAIIGLNQKDLENQGILA